MDTVVRRAELPDAPALARVHLETYFEQLGREKLESFTVEMREVVWTNSLERNNNGTWVAERDGRILGFSRSGPPRDGPPVRQLELWALYLLQAEHGTGAGQALLDAPVAESPASLWVLASNPRARRFYEGTVSPSMARKSPTPAGRCWTCEWCANSRPGRAFHLLESPIVLIALRRMTQR